MKDLLLLEHVLSFKSKPLFGKISSPREPKQEVVEVVLL